MTFECGYLYPWTKPYERGVFLSAMAAHKDCPRCKGRAGKFVMVTDEDKQEVMEG